MHHSIHPTVGLPARHEIMKQRLLISITILCLTAAICSCKKNNPADIEEPVPPSKNPEVFYTGDKIMLNDYMIVVHSIKETTNPDSVFKPDKKMKYILVDATINNIGEEAIVFNTFYFKLQEGKKKIHAPYFNQAQKPALNAGKLESGKTARGWITFHVPENMGKYQVLYDPDGIEEQRVIIRRKPKKKNPPEKAS